MAAKRTRAKGKAGGARTTSPRAGGGGGASRASGASGSGASRASGASGRSSGTRRASGAGGAASDARVQQIQRLIDVMVAAGAVEVEMEEAGAKLRVRLREDRAVLYEEPRATSRVPPGDTHASAPPPVSMAPQAAAAPPAPAGDVFRSPLVGTFYRSPSPDNDPFVKVGDRIKAEQTICIIEAMKVMNEIKAEEDAEVVEILAQNGEAVEYGQPLFVLKGL